MRENQAVNALGGEPFLYRAGATKVETCGTRLTVSLPNGRTKEGITFIKVDQSPAGFDVEFWAQRGRELINRRVDVKPDLLPVVFADVTGLRI
jgi:hypothetical protein